jgi:ATP/maltotriose-dependent transcriptional regulator MalT
LNLYWGLDRPTAAEAVLDHSAEPAQQAGLRALRRRFLLHAGRCEQALAVVDAVLDTPQVSKSTVVEAMVTATTALVACGRYDDVIATATRGLQLGQQFDGRGLAAVFGRAGRESGRCLPVERAAQCSG